MKTRKQRKYYSLNGMKRAGKVEQIIPSEYVVYVVDHEGMREIASGDYIAICAGREPAVTKDVARITAAYPRYRLSFWAIAKSSSQSVADQLNTLGKEWVTRSLAPRTLELDFKTGGTVKITEVVNVKATP